MNTFIDHFEIFSYRSVITDDGFHFRFGYHFGQTKNSLAQSSAQSSNIFIPSSIRSDLTTHAVIASLIAIISLSQLAN